MDDDDIRQSVLFSDLVGKAVVAKFDQDHASSDGGAALLQACDRQLGLTEALIGGIDDRRQLGKVRHAIGDLCCVRAARTALRSAQVSTVREHLMKLGTWLESSVRRIDFTPRPRQTSTHGP